MRNIGTHRLAALAWSAATMVGLAGSSAAGHAQAWAKANLDKSPRHGEYITIHEAGGRTLQAWVVYPESKGKAPVVIMIHEIFGLSDWAREMADEVAAAGYIVVEPDLLSGYGPAAAAVSLGTPVMPAEHAAHLLQTSSTSSSTASRYPGAGCDPSGCASLPASPQTSAPGAPNQQGGAAFAASNPGGTAAFSDQSTVIRAVSSLPDPGVLADLEAAADYGKHLPAASGKLFVAGFCWGGGKTFLFATRRRDLSASFVFYGPPPPAEALRSLTAPVYGFYAANDARITSTVDQTRAEVKAAGKTFEPVIYDGAGHGFMRAGEAPDASAENSAARQAGFHRLVQLLGGLR